MLKTKTKVAIGFVSILSIAAGVLTSNFVASRVSADTSTTFQVNVQESLTVSLDVPSTPATDGGTLGTFMRNTIGLEVTSNNTTGFTATMYANDTALTNSSNSSFTIPTLGTASTGCSSYTTGVVKSSFPANCWGYSLDTTGDNPTTPTYTYNAKIYNETNAGNNDSYYHPIPTSSAPATVLTGTGASTATREIYFGTKSDVTQASGTYTGTVIFGVVTGTVNANNDSSSAVTPPSNPATNSDTSVNTATYDSTNNRTVYYTTSGNTTTTTVSAGDTTDAYADAAGVTENTSVNIASSAPVAAGLIVAGGVALTSAAVLFALAKRDNDDDEEEEQI